MENKDTLQKIESKKMKPVDYIYLGVILFLLIVTVIMFYFSTSFIIGHINKIFLPVSEVSHNTLNAENYKLVEKKLNLPINTPDGKAIVNTQVGETPVLDKTTTTPENELDKSNITLNVLNGSKKSGVASILSKILITDGFLKTTTGDSKTKYPITTIFIKDNAKKFTSEIQNLVIKTYPNAITKTNPDDSEFDIIIIIGS